MESRVPPKYIPFEASKTDLLPLQLDLLPFLYPFATSLKRELASSVFGSVLDGYPRYCESSGERRSTCRGWLARWRWWRCVACSPPTACDSSWVGGAPWNGSLVPRTRFSMVACYYREHSNLLPETIFR